MSIARTDQRRDFDVSTRVQLLENDADRHESSVKDLEREFRGDVSGLYARIDQNQEKTNQKIDEVQREMSARLTKILWALVGLLISVTSAVIVYALTTLTTTPGG